MIISILYIVIFLLISRYSKLLKINGLPHWTLPLAFGIKILMGLLFSYVYIYSMKDSSEPSDAMRFLDESKQLYTVFFKSKYDFFSLFTGIGDNETMIHKHLKNTFIWNAGDFTFINDSRNTIRVNSLFHFISFGSQFVNVIFMCFLSLIGIQQLYLAIQPYSKLKPILLFFTLLLFPSLLFWSSSVLKEPLLILGIGLFGRACLGILSLKKKIILGISGILTLILFKPYILVCLLPGIIFYLVYQYIFKQQLLKTITVFTLLIISGILLSPVTTTKITNDLSTKQFHLENVGKGGIHVYGKQGFYYFKPHQYKNLKKEGKFVELIHSCNVIFLPFNTSKNTKPLKKHLEVTGEKWLIHIIMPGTNSYIKTTSINFSFKQLILNIPEALINTLLRPFPFDEGNVLKYPAMFEVILISLFLFIAIYFRRTIDLKVKGIIVCLILFTLILSLLIGWTTPIIGAIVRFRFPAHLALIIISFMLIDPEKIKFNKKENG